MFTYQRRQASSPDVFHADEVQVVGNAEIEDANHVLVGNLAGQNQFLLKSLQDIGISGQVGTNDLERDYPVKLTVPGFVNRTHATVTQQLQDFIPGLQGGAQPGGWMDGGWCFRCRRDRNGQGTGSLDLAG